MDLCNILQTLKLESSKTVSLVLSEQGCSDPTGERTQQTVQIPYYQP